MINRNALGEMVAKAGCTAVIVAIAILIILVLI